MYGFPEPYMRGHPGGKERVVLEARFVECCQGGKGVVKNRPVMSPSERRWEFGFVVVGDSS